jgi:YHS domain-containing protein
MIRLVGFLLLAVILISVLRSVIGLLTRLLADFLGHSDANRSGSTGAGSERASGDAPAAASPGGTLKKDPVCGTYIDPGASVKKTVNGAVVHFCSAECRDRYAG